MGKMLTVRGKLKAEFRMFFKYPTMEENTYCPFFIPESRVDRFRVELNNADVKSLFMEDLHLTLNNKLDIYKVNLVSSYWNLQFFLNCFCNAV